MTGDHREFGRDVPEPRAASGEVVSVGARRGDGRRRQRQRGQHEHHQPHRPLPPRLQHARPHPPRVEARDKAEDRQHERRSGGIGRVILILKRRGHQSPPHAVEVHQHQRRRQARQRRQTAHRAATAQVAQQHGLDVAQKPRGHGRARSDLGALAPRQPRRGKQQPARPRVHLPGAHQRGKHHAPQRELPHAHARRQGQQHHGQHAQPREVVGQHPRARRKDVHRRRHRQHRRRRVPRSQRDPGHAPQPPHERERDQGTHHLHAPHADGEFALEQGQHEVEAGCGGGEVVGEVGRRPLAGEDLDGLLVIEELVVGDPVRDDARQDHAPGDEEKEQGWNPGWQ